MKKALICGISGQDGGYLAKLLLAKGYEVWGTSRDAELSELGNLHRLGIRDQVNVVSMTLVDFRSVLQTLSRTQPDEIYNLAGQTSVGLSFEQPVETLESVATGSLNLLESLRFAKLPARLYNASSGECFGNTADEAADESTPFRPRSPYAVAKAAAFWEVANYREAYGIFACSGILFNHESPLRSTRFVTRKITASAARIAAGSKETLALGNTSIRRDWGWAEEYVEAMWLMLQQERPDDYVIATGSSDSLEDFLAAAFDAVGLQWREHVKVDRGLLRPTDISVSRANPSKALHELGWRAKRKMRDIARTMVDAERLSLLAHSVSTNRGEGSGGGIE